VNINNEVYAVIMAGGVGSRFWPRSREKTPKQLLEIGGKTTMIQETIRRVQPIIQDKNIFIVTNKNQRQEVQRQIPSIPAENILVEPLGRNTAPCIGLAALFVARLNPKGVMVVLPADHLILNEEEFIRVLSDGVEVARESSSIVTIGIKPTRPETGYGYIQFIEDESQKNPYVSKGAYRVKTFAEKPNAQIAEQFVKSGDFLWNSGMFLWRADVILREIEQSLPELYGQLKAVEPSIGTSLFDQNLDQAYGIIRSVSIDYGVMEKTKDVYVLKGDFGWNDVGSWDEVYRIAEKDEKGISFTGKAITINSKNSYIHAGGKLVAIVGVNYH
jgi:mannose-1-phosphate guanylyltransferase